jgi:hypothetical protein
MEFPSDWAVTQTDEFDAAAARSHGKAVMMIQARPNGRLLDHFRVATGGSEILEAADITSNPELKGRECWPVTSFGDGTQISGET